MRKSIVNRTMRKTRETDRMRMTGHIQPTDLMMCRKMDPSPAGLAGGASLGASAAGAAGSWARTVCQVEEAKPQSETATTQQRKNEAHRVRARPPETPMFRSLAKKGKEIVNLTAAGPLPVAPSRAVH